MSRAVGNLTRLRHIRRTLIKYGLVDLLDQHELNARARLGLWFALGKQGRLDTPLAQRIRLALEELGPVFIKFGQALSTRPDLLPQDIAQELLKLQDQVPPFSGKEAIQIVRECYGDETDTIFSSIDEEPLASASVAQVHAATLQPGNAIVGQDGHKSDQVVIKILRPGVEQAIENDLNLMRGLAKLVQKYWSKSAQFKPVKIVEEFSSTIRGELDLRQEAANGSQMGANFEQSDLIYVPRIYWDYTQATILVMERIYGTSVRDVAVLKEKGYDLKQLAGEGVTTFFKQAFDDNFFHADMHPGNIFVSDKGKWIAIDFGIMGVLEDADKRYLAEMLLGFFNRDYRAIANSHLRSGWIPADTNLSEFENAIRMVCEPNFAKPIAEISFGQVLLDLFQTVQRFNMPIQPQLALLYKTLLQIEGLGRQLYPQLDLWDTAKPFLENWMKQQLSPQTLLADLKRDWPQWRTHILELPKQLQNQRNQKLNHTAALQRHTQELIKTRRSRFHLAMGVLLATIGLVWFVSSLSGLVPAMAIYTESFSDWPLALAFVGGIWAYLGTR